MSGDLSTRYLGLDLQSPLVVGACPLTSDLTAVQRLEEAGVGAVVLPSLFQEQIERQEARIERLYEYQIDLYDDTADVIGELDYLNKGPSGYLRFIEQLKATVDIPVIASLNGYGLGDWIRHARLAEEAGADALELNCYFIATTDETSQQVEDRYIELAAEVRGEVEIPLSIKIRPYFTALPQFARRLVDVGADGLVLFDRYLPPEIDVERLHYRPHLELSVGHELRVPLRWISVLRDHVNISLAATTGIQTGDDVVRALLVGADVAMIASTVLRHGPGQVQAMLDQLRDWLEQHNYSTSAQIRGLLGQMNVTDPALLTRANYIRSLLSYTQRQS